MMPKIHGSGRCGAREPDHAHKVAEDVVEPARWTNHRPRRVVEPELTLRQSC